MRRKKIPKVLRAANLRGHSRATLTALKRALLRRIISMANPELVPANTESSVWRTRWSWVGAKALVVHGERYADVELALKQLVEERVVVQRTVSGKKYQVTIA